ncbi:MAG: transposase [Thermoleophilaceae bacterium]|nr:transposase [Thermoleophilaceae bacterium]MDQ3355356.1 transposase [Actinomycetota bacterium]
MRLCWPGCARSQLAELPAGVSGSAFGPRLQAHLATLAGVYRLSRRQVALIAEEIFGVAISTGAVDRTIMRMSAILADPWAELREAVRQAEVVHADETGWRLRGAQQWLWLAASALHACYRVDPSRSKAAAKELLGEDFGGFVVSDRYAGHHLLELLHQQLCWAHVIRRLSEISERSGAAGKLGRELLRAAREVPGRSGRGSSPLIGPTWSRAATSPGFRGAWRRFASGSRRCSARARAGAANGPRACAPGWWTSTRRCGPSARSEASSRPTTPPNARSATP